MFDQHQHKRTDGRTTGGTGNLINEEHCRMNKKKSKKTISNKDDVSQMTNSFSSTLTIEGLLDTYG